MQKILFTDQDVVQGRALFLGERLDLSTLRNTESLGRLPLVVPAGENGCAVLFAYGAVVLFGLSPVQEASFLSYLKPLVIEPFTVFETEEFEVKLDPAATGRVENGVIWLRTFSTECLQIVASVLAKSVVLAHYEVGTASIFEQLEPFAEGLQRNTRNERWGKDLLRQLGRTLSIQNKIVGRVEISDKPDLLWDAPDLERIYARLEDEYEIRERQVTLEKKLGLVSSTAETVLELLQHNSSLRVEWYVVVLIVVEILLSVYELFVV
ncbi:MAG TPA: RMD1 family protein [Chroococcidiopsis sp.]